MNLIEVKVGNSLELIGTVKDVLYRTLSKALRSTIKKWDLMKLGSFCTAKDTVLDEEAAYRMGNVFLQLYIQQRTNIQNI